MQQGMDAGGSHIRIALAIPPRIECRSRIAVLRRAMSREMGRGIEAGQGDIGIGTGIPEGIEQGRGPEESKGALRATPMAQPCDEPAGDGPPGKAQRPASRRWGASTSPSSLDRP